MSPPIRHEAADALHTRLGYQVATIEGASHFAAWDAPTAFAETVAAHLERNGADHGT
jgi:pimeloyl-ACP methyl ester carboxylesterase